MRAKVLRRSWQVKGTPESSTTRSIETARVLDRTMTTGPGGEPVKLGEIAAAFVTDTSVLGATGPIVGARSRYELASAFGGLSFFRVLLDHRRYVMPVKPYTIAARVVHVGQYGRDADDPRRREENQNLPPRRHVR